MENKKIRELAAIMKEMGLTVVDYKDDGVSIRIERAAAAAVSPASGSSAADAQIRQAPRDEPDTNDGTIVRSPMVGVFYSSPGADAKPYAQLGDKVSSGDILCMIEAMKIFNEITAENSGVITGIFVENKQIVEYGQPLFRIETENA